MASVIDYHIHCINPTDFELKLNMPVTGRIVKIIFNKVRSKLFRSHNINIPGNPDTIESVIIPPQYYKILKLNIHSIVGKTAREYKADGIELLSYDISSARFYKIGEGWVMEIILKGLYTDKR